MKQNFSAGILSAAQCIARESWMGVTSAQPRRGAPIPDQINSHWIERRRTISC